MNVLFLTHRLPYAPNRGDRIRAYYLLQEASTFANVSVFSLVHDDEEAARAGEVPFASDVTTARVTRIRNLVRGGLGLLSSRPLTHALLDAPSIPVTLAALVRRSRPDLVLAYCSGMARFALEPPLAPLPFVLDMVDVDSTKWMDLATHSGWRNVIYRREGATLRAFERTATNRARATLVVNDRERDQLRPIAPDARVEVVPNGVDVDAFRPPGPPGRDPVVVFCGVMDYAPNEEGVQWFAKRVWPRVRASQPAARFLVVGSRPTRGVKALTEEDSSIEIVGEVPLVQPYLWRSAVSIAPLRVARGVQNKVLEAIAAGLPVVVTQAVHDGLPGVAARACAVADTEETFARSVIALLEQSPEERRRRAVAADMAALSWHERLRPINEIFHEAAASVAFAETRR